MFRVFPLSRVTCRIEMKMTFPFREIFFRVNFFIFAIVSIGKIRRITFVYAKVFAKMSDILHENINF
jgi:hypothetical protein